LVRVFEHEPAFAGIILCDLNTSPMGKGDKNIVTVDRLKVVIRRLPANIPETIFWDSVKPWVTDDNVTWRSFVQGKVGVRYAPRDRPLI
jgi:hypothetical protein